MRIGGDGLGIREIGVDMGRRNSKSGVGVLRGSQHLEMGQGSGQGKGEGRV